MVHFCINKPTYGGLAVRGILFCGLAARGLLFYALGNNRCKTLKVEELSRLEVDETLYKEYCFCKEILEFPDI
jgi:hypothetical protein